MAAAMTQWIVVAVAGAATIAIRAAGPLALGGRQLPERVMGMIEALAPALLAALVATATIGSGESLVIDERLLGLAAASLALAVRAPVLVVLVAAATATAIARQL
jgi:uncharacterized membrane protein